MNPWIAFLVWGIGWCLASLPPYFNKRARRAKEGKTLPWGAEFSVSAVVVNMAGLCNAFIQQDNQSIIYSYNPSDIISLLCMGMAAAGVGNWMAARSRKKEADDV